MYEKTIDFQLEKKNIYVYSEFINFGYFGYFWLLLVTLWLLLVTLWLLLVTLWLLWLLLVSLSRF